MSTQSKKKRHNKRSFKEMANDNTEHVLPEAKKQKLEKNESKNKSDHESDSIQEEKKENINEINNNNKTEQNKTEKQKTNTLKDNNDKKYDINFSKTSMNIDSILIDIAKATIKNNWHRTCGWHYFTTDELKRINEIIKGEIRIDGGYCFLDEKNGKEGLIRLYCGDANPKWGFIEKDNQIDVGFA
eukprot:470286_1